MPTGYTAGVANGKVTDFREYAIQCARAFGACVMMRDEPLSKPIPEAFDVSDYHIKALERCREELTRLEAVDDAESCRLAAEDFAKQMQSRKEAIDRKRTERRRYEAMLEKARAYIPPTEDHKGYAEFLVSQLEESIKFDCDESPYQDVPQCLDGLTWKANRMQKLREDIAYHTEKHKEEIERTEGRNRWIAELRKSLGIENAK